uniref:calcium-binding protein n=1 Tax=Pseudomonas anguilliseptica TaxID=53406 RepID=UPI003735B519
DISLRPELLNTGVALLDATATASLQGTDVSLSGTNPVRFSRVLNGIRSQTHDTVVLRQPANQPVQFNRLHWVVEPGATAPVTEGGGANDTLVGSGGPDIISGGAGDDWIVGGKGDDILIGGIGMDVLLGGEGADTMIVTGEDVHYDVFNGGAGHDRVLGGDADDVIRLHQFIDEWRVELIDGRAGKNRIDGTLGNDALNFTDTELMNIELIDGLAGDDIIYGSQSDDVIRGGAGNDQLFGNGGNDSFLFEGDQGINTVSGGAGSDRILGGENDDWIRFKLYNAEMGVELIDGGAGLNYLAGDDTDNALDFRETTLTNISRINGLAGNDTIAGSQGNDVIQGGAGDDTLYGMGGDDIFLMLGKNNGFDLVSGAEGSDGIKGGPGDDDIGLKGFGGDLRVEWIDGDGGFNRILATSGDDSFDFRDTRLVGINEINMGDGNDTLGGSVDADVIVGGKGDDTLYGMAGDDTFRVMASDNGFDLIDGGPGYDRIQGNDGDTVIGLKSITAQFGIELIDGGAGHNIIRGNGEANTLDFIEIELRNIARIEGGDGGDQVRGSIGHDVLAGGRGNDQLYGGPGNDTYIFALGDGMDHVLDMGMPEDVDRLVLDAPFGPERVWLKRVGENLHVSFVGTTDVVVLAGVYGSEQNRIEKVELASGLVLPANHAAALEQYMASFPIDPAARSAQQNAQLAAALQQAWIRP